tara:strand:- start:10993 stop:11646 length:654 start_codon:yes stop_codon:yes gene_type:complete
MTNFRRTSFDPTAHIAKVATPGFKTVSKGMGLSMAGLGKAGALMSGASSILGPVSMGLQVAGMLHGAWNQAKQANKMKADLAKKADTIQNQITQNSVALRDDLSDIDEEYQGKQTELGEDIGETLEDASSNLGKIIKRGRGLLTGAETISKQEIMDDTGNFAERSMERLNTQRGGDYAGIIDPYNRQQAQSHQSLLDIASQRKQLESQDSMWENLLG